MKMYGGYICIKPEKSKFTITELDAIEHDTYYELKVPVFISSDYSTRLIEKTKTYKELELKRGKAIYAPERKYIEEWLKRERETAIRDTRALLKSLENTELTYS